jgi:cytochrome oxidase Cu insertion factor (SCO1/SenC/PrrC family)
MMLSRASKLVLAAMAVAVTAGCGASEPQQGGPGGTSASAPSFTVTTFTGERFALEAMRGTPVVLNFWESW